MAMAREEKCPYCEFMVKTFTHDLHALYRDNSSIILYVLKWWPRLLERHRQSFGVHTRTGEMDRYLSTLSGILVKMLDGETNPSFDESSHHEHFRVAKLCEDARSCAIFNEPLILNPDADNACRTMKNRIFEMRFNFAVEEFRSLIALMEFKASRTNKDWKSLVFTSEEVRSKGLEDKETWDFGLVDNMEKFFNMGMAKTSAKDVYKCLYFCISRTLIDPKKIAKKTKNRDTEDRESLFTSLDADLQRELEKTKRTAEAAQGGEHVSDRDAQETKKKRIRKSKSSSLFNEQNLIRLFGALPLMFFGISRGVSFLDVPSILSCSNKTKYKILYYTLIWNKTV